jgi:DNA-binding NarL/FixJ family response regulator
MTVIGVGQARGFTNIQSSLSSMSTLPSSLNVLTKPFEALKLIRERACDLAVLDLDMPAMSGLELLKHVRRERPETPVLILSVHTEEWSSMYTADPSSLLHKACLKAGADYDVSKGEVKKLIEICEKLNSIMS